jgi:Mg/Co/Ni transporter MgtE
MLIGYMAGALNRHSENFRRMLISGIVSATIGGIMLFGIFYLSPVNVVTGVTGFLLTVLTRTACGVIIPVIAKVFMWYGMSMNKKTNV